MPLERYGKNILTLLDARGKVVNQRADNDPHLGKGGLSLIKFDEKISLFNDAFQVDIEGLRAGTQDWLGCPRDRKGPYSTWIRECRAYGDDGGGKELSKS